MNIHGYGKACNEIASRLGYIINGVRAWNWEFFESWRGGFQRVEWFLSAPLVAYCGGGALCPLLYYGLEFSQLFAILLWGQKDASGWAGIVSALQASWCGCQLPPRAMP